MNLKHFADTRHLRSAILSSADLLEKGDYGPVEDMVKEAVSVGLTRILVQITLKIQKEDYKHSKTTTDR